MREDRHQVLIITKGSSSQGSFSIYVRDEKRAKIEHEREAGITSRRLD